MLLSKLHTAIQEVAERLGRPADQLEARIRGDRIEVFITALIPLPVAVIEESALMQVVSIYWIHDAESITFETKPLVP